MGSTRRKRRLDPRSGPMPPGEAPAPHWQGLPPGDPSRWDAARGPRPRAQPCERPPPVTSLPPGLSYPSRLRGRIPPEPTTREHHMAQDTPLSPEIEPAERAGLTLAKGHQVYWGALRQSPPHIPVLFVHGGPGAGCSPTSLAASSIPRPGTSCWSTSGAPAAPRLWARLPTTTRRG